jgi:hypothetical protein
MKPAKGKKSIGTIYRFCLAGSAAGFYFDLHLEGKNSPLSAAQTARELFTSRQLGTLNLGDDTDGSIKNMSLQIDAARITADNIISQQPWYPTTT